MCSPRTAPSLLAAIALLLAIPATPALCRAAVPGEAGSGTAAPPDLAAAQRLQGEATAAYREGDLATFVDRLERALAANPASQATRYNLACGYARTRRHDEALELLAGLVRARIDFGMAEDPDLEPLRDGPETGERFRALVTELERRTAPVVAGTVVHSVGQLGLVPEGIAVDPATGRIFFGSMRTGEIYVLGPGGGLSRFAEIRHGGLPLAALGLEVDDERGLLWAVGNASFIVEGFDPEAPVVSGVFGYDLTSGEERQRHTVTVPEGTFNPGFNDVALAPGGGLYLTGHTLARVDGGHGKGETAPRPVPLDRPLLATNGIAVAPDGETLYVSIYPVGLARVDPGAGTWTRLAEPEDTPLIGIDGLYWHDGGLIGIQNGLQPWRLLRMELDETGTAVTAVRFIELANPAVTPTTGALSGGDLLYVGQAPAPKKTVPSHLPLRLAPFLGETVVLRAPLD